MFFVLFLGTVILGQVVPQNFEVMEGLLTEINQCKQIREKFSELKTEFSDIEIQGIHKDMRLKILTSVNSRLRAELRRVIQTNDLLKDKLREMSLKLGETRQPTSGEYTQSYPTPLPLFLMTLSVFTTLLFSADGQKKQIVWFLIKNRFKLFRITRVTNVLSQCKLCKFIWLFYLKESIARITYILLTWVLKDNLKKKTIIEHTLLYIIFLF